MRIKESATWGDNNSWNSWNNYCQQQLEQVTNIGIKSYLLANSTAVRRDEADEWFTYKYSSTPTLFNSPYARYLRQQEVMKSNR